jgi:uncharacterized protein (UPF0333 family)
MKGQVSIEFMLLLILTLLGSAILISDLERKSAAFQDNKDFKNAEKISQKVNYKLSYIRTHRNSTVNLRFSPKIETEFEVEVNSSETLVSSPAQNFTFSSRYSGSNQFRFNTSKRYEISYGSGVKVE